MSQLPVPPHIQILVAALADMESVDYVDALGDDLAKIAGLLNQDGSPGTAITFRHARNRPPPVENRPVMCLVWHGNSVDPQQQDLNAWEQARQMDAELYLDLNLPTEDSQDDPTGWLIASTMTAAAFQAVRSETSLTAALSDWRTQGDLTPEEDISGPDNARLVQSMSVLYRVLTEEPNTLLARGVSGG